MQAVKRTDVHQVLAFALTFVSLLPMAVRSGRAEPATNEVIAWGTPVKDLQLGMVLDGPAKTGTATADSKSVYLHVSVRNVGKSTIRFLASIHTCLLGEGGSNALVVSKIVFKPRAGGDSVTLVYQGWNHLSLLDKRRPKSEQPQQTLDQSFGKTDVQLTPETAKRMSSSLTPGESRIVTVGFTPNAVGSEWGPEKPGTLQPGTYDVTAVFTVDQEFSDWKGELRSAALQVSIPPPEK